MLKLHNLKVSNEYKKVMKNALDAPLEKLEGLRPDYIGYRSFYPDGNSMVYCSNEKWQDNNIDLNDTANHYAQEILLLKRQKLKIIVRSPGVINTSFLKGLHALDMCNTIIIYKEEYGLIHMLCFIFKTTNISTLNYFVNERERFEKVAEDCFHISYKISNNKKYNVLKEKLFSKQISSRIFTEEYPISFSENKDLLTARQKDCVDLLSKGATDKDIANILGITPKTVEYHISKIRTILGCHTRLDICKKLKK